MSEIVDDVEHALTDEISAEDCSTDDASINDSLSKDLFVSTLSTVEKSFIFSNQILQKSFLWTHNVACVYSSKLQYAISVPNLYLASWFIINIIFTLYSKYLYTAFDFKFPLTHTMIHMLFSYLGIIICKLLSLFVPATVTFRMLFTLLWFSVVFTVNICLSNFGLLLVSINLHQVFRALGPIFTIVLTTLIWKEPVPRTLIIPVFLIILGVVCAVWGDMEFSMLGLFIVTLSAAFSALKGILTQKTQVGEYHLSALDTLKNLIPFALIELLLLIITTDELFKLKNYDYNRRFLWFHLSLNGCMAFLVNFVSFKCAALHSPLTLNIAGNIKLIMTCFFGVLSFKGHFTIGFFFGIILTTIGAYLYAVENRKL